jgi:hypothetical protein
MPLDVRDGFLPATRKSHLVQIGAPNIGSFEGFAPVDQLLHSNSIRNTPKALHAIDDLIVIRRSGEFLDESQFA